MCRLLSASILLCLSCSKLHWLSRCLNDNQCSRLRSLSTSILSSNVCTLRGENTEVDNESYDNTDWHDRGEGKGCWWLLTLAELAVDTWAFWCLFSYNHKYEQQPSISRLSKIPKQHQLQNLLFTTFFSTTMPEQYGSFHDGIKFKALFNVRANRSWEIPYSKACHLSYHCYSIRHVN